MTVYLPGELLDAGSDYSRHSSQRWRVSSTFHFPPVYISAPSLGCLGPMQVNRVGFDQGRSDPHSDKGISDRMLGCRAPVSERRGLVLRESRYLSMCVVHCRHCRYAQKGAEVFDASQCSSIDVDDE